MDHLDGTYYFLGANTPTGFRSLYDQFIDPETDRALYIIKGGPGCGKSTFMKQIARCILNAGHSVECIRCSGDPDSLDGILIPELKIAYVDGTAPHAAAPAENKPHHSACCTIGSNRR